MVSTRCLRGVGSFSSTNPRPALAATSRKRIATVGSSRPGCANKRTRRSVATRLDPIHIKRSAAVRNISKSLYFKGKLCRSPTLYSDEKSTIWVRNPADLHGDCRKLKLIQHLRESESLRCA